MAFSSSPAFAGRSSTAILDSPRKGNVSDSMEDDDDLSIVSQSPYFTQPTQIVERTTLKPTAASMASSPRSIVEVPASSPFKPQSALRNGGRLASVMAPAGTAFRAPPKAQQPPMRKISAVERGVKRPIEVIMLSDDDLDTPAYKKVDSSGDERPGRGDIKPSSFRAREPKPTTNLAGAKPCASEAMSKNSISAGSPLTSPPPRKFVPVMDWASSDSDSDSLPSLNRLTKPSKQPEATQPPKPARRRLMQGRRAREPSPASSPVKPKPVQTTLDAIVARPKKPVIVLSDSDGGEDEYTKEKSPESDDSPEVLAEELAFNDRVLRYLNTCNTIQLIAIANVKEESAQLMLDHQPFSNIEAAKNVTISQKKQRKKSSKVAIGEEVVSAVKSYVRALDGIDHVMAVCDSKADDVKRSTSRWVMDTTGQPRNDAKSDDEKPLTPRSMGETKLVDLPVGQPKLMNGHCTMKSFQIYGLNWLFLLYQKNHGAILADDMGLGKTCQVISFICTIVEDWEKNGRARAKSHAWPNLIVVPPSTLANWKAEFKRFAPDLNVTLYQGSQSVRDEIADEILDDPLKHHVILTSYTQVSRQEDISNLKSFQPNAAIFDEGHKMKNPKTKLYKDLIRVTADWRLILSGTPVQNNLMEMISLLQFIEPDLFRDHYDDLEALFSQKVSLTAVSKGALLYSERVGRARSILEPFILQRRKEQVLKDLPPKTAKVVYCEMDETQSAIYNEYERRFRKADSTQTTAAEKTGRDNDNNNVWIQLRKSAIHPQLFRRFFTDKKVDKIAQVLMKRVPQSELRQPNLTHLANEIKALSDFEIHLWCRDYKCIREYDVPDGSWMESAKVQSLLKLIRQYQANGDRALVFTRYAKVIELLGESLAFEGIEYLSLQGNTDVSERQELINQFNSDSSIPVFLLTTGSGGTGINLTSANKVIIFDQSDNPQDDIQAENRAHRLGQTKPVEIIRLISKNTIEELVYKACQKKLELANKVTGWAAVEMTASEMEAAVRQELLKGGGISTPPNESVRSRS
ncbi:SNF2 family N-terminal domain-containing protein [Cercophora newfieldiana]|uniref:SNF2 family N-terminal domain-containing protein n=1 Tax=Cercophora newfieldiana TaxID=92897 RepID=A0AA39YPJ4_9PEZI|nr:SNF2 family N-terminal domain-containing protein [Cercophora newfieldiana]